MIIGIRIDDNIGTRIAFNKGSGVLRTRFFKIRVCRHVQKKKKVKLKI